MSYRQDPRDQYYNNGFGNQYNQYQGYTDGYQQASNPRMRNDGYRPPIRNPYSAPNPNIKGPSQGRTADDDDNESVVSSVYSQPSVAGFTPSNNMRYYQEQSLETTEPRRQSLLYNNEYDYPYPPSPFAASTNTHNSTTGLTTGSSQQGLPLVDQNENNYMTDNMRENYYQDHSQNNYQDHSQNNYQDHSQNNYQDHSQNNYQDYSQNNYQDHSQNNYQDYSQNTQPQYDVYNDFNNNFKNDEKYNDGESRNNTLIGPDGSHDSNPYAMNVDSGNGKGARQSTSGDHYVVTPKKDRRCAFCSRKTCVIITFVILVLLAAGMYFVWPRIPVVTFLSPSAAGDAEITTAPVVVKMPMELQFQLDNRENWLPYRFKSLQIDALDVVSLKKVASGERKGFSIRGRAKSTVSIPLPINYESSGQNDPILQTFIESCTQPQQHSLKLRIEMKMFILGLDWVKKPTVSIPVIDFPCPFNITRPPTADQALPAPTDETNSASAPTPAPGEAPPTDGTPGGAPAPAPGGAPAPAPGGAPAPAPNGAPAPGGAPPTDGAPAPGGAPAPAPNEAPAPGGAPPTDGAPAPGGVKAPGAPGEPAPGAAPGAAPPANEVPADGGP